MTGSYARAHSKADHGIGQPAPRPTERSNTTVDKKAGKASPMQSFEVVRET